MKRSREPEEGVQTAASSPAADADGTGGNTAPLTPQSTRVSKITGLDESAIDDSPSSVEMKCVLPGHREPLVFKSYAEYEAHYTNTHTNRCHECRKNFPSEHLLNLHIEECHDAFAAVLREKGEHTYSCFVEACDRKCGTPQKRRMHLIDKHMYPKNYFFAVTKEGIDGRSSLLLEGGHHRRRSSTSQAGGHKATPRRLSLRQPEPAESKMDIEQPAPLEDQTVSSKADGQHGGERADTDMADLTSAMSTLQFVPTSVRFGRGRGKTGFARK